MTRDEVIALARDSGYIGVQFTSISTLERFAALVAAREREACAKVVEETDLVDYEHCMVLHTDGHATLKNAAAAIRSRT